MANLKDIIIIENMESTDGSPIGRVEIQPAEGDDGCIQIWDMDGADTPQAIWLDREGAEILRDYVEKWLDRGE